MFTHLHVHTENSMLDGLSRIDQMIAKAKELGMDSLAITDHGVLYGAIDFYKSAVSAGIKPIIGCEMYVAQNSRHEKNPQYKKPYHLTVLAKDITGYQNLVIDQQPYLQGYLSMMNICLTKKYGFSGLHINTAGAFVDQSNVDAVAPLAAVEIR